MTVYDEVNVRRQKMGKRIFKSVVSWILALAMVVTLAPVSPEKLRVDPTV